MALVIVIFVIGTVVAWAILLSVWGVKPSKPPQPPERFLWINIGGVDGPKTSFSNEDQP